MRFKNYALISFIDSFETQFAYHSIRVVKNGETNMVAFPITDKVVAIYDWSQFDDLEDNQKGIIIMSKYEEVKTIYKETIQLLFDKFPKTIREDVYRLTHRYRFGDKAYPIDLIEISSDYIKVVQLYENISKDRWVIKLLGMNFCCVTNNNAARQIFNYLKRDCYNLINERWK